MYHLRMTAEKLSWLENFTPLLLIRVEIAKGVEAVL